MREVMKVVSECRSYHYLRFIIRISVECLAARCVGGEETNSQPVSECEIRCSVTHRHCESPVLCCVCM